MRHKQRENRKTKTANMERQGDNHQIIAKTRRQIIIKSLSQTEVNVAENTVTDNVEWNYL